MLKTLCLAVSIAAIGGGAMAQGPPAVLDWQHAPHRAGSVVGPREDDYSWLRYERQLKADLEARRRTLAATGDTSDAAATAPLRPPAGWTAGEPAWREHMRMCLQRYRTYNPETDTYYPRHGVRARCSL